MRQVVFFVPVFVSILFICGCDTKKQDQVVADQLVTDARESQSEFDTKVREQLDSGEGISPDIEHVDQIADMIEQAAANSSSDQSQVLLDQAETLRKVQAIVTPYQTAMEELTKLGGLDPTTINELEQFDRRIELVEELGRLNEIMDENLPALIRKLDQDAGADEIELKIDLIKQIRQTDRESFQSMNGYLLILQQLWGQYGIDTDGSIMFSPDVEDELIQKFNVFADHIQKMTAEQARLQRVLIDLDSP
jgi:hypothetical protein